MWGGRRLTRALVIKGWPTSKARPSNSWTTEQWFVAVIHLQMEEPYTHTHSFSLPLVVLFLSENFSLLFLLSNSLFALSILCLKDIPISLRKTHFLIKKRREEWKGGGLHIFALFLFFRLFKSNKLDKLMNKHLRFLTRKISRCNPWNLLIRNSKCRLYWSSTVKVNILHTYCWFCVSF